MIIKGNKHMEINNSKKVWIISYSPYKHPINILPCAIIQHPICVKEHQLKVNNQQQTFQANYQTSRKHNEDNKVDVFGSMINPVD